MKKKALSRDEEIKMVADKIKELLIKHNCKLVYVETRYVIEDIIKIEPKFVVMGAENIIKDKEVK